MKEIKIPYKPSLFRTAKTHQLYKRNSLPIRILILFKKFKVIQFYLIHSGTLLYSLIYDYGIEKMF
jgi:hypothetical protein